MEHRCGLATQCNLIGSCYLSGDINFQSEKGGNATPNQQPGPEWKFSSWISYVTAAIESAERNQCDQTGQIIAYAFLLTLGKLQRGELIVNQPTEGDDILHT